jgi:maltodextrin utilization protein YvdJ
MKIIKITKQEWKSISPYKTGVDNQRLDKEYQILFNTNEMITAKENEYGGTYITYKKAMVDGMNCKETFEEFTNLINN